MRAITKSDRSEIILSTSLNKTKLVVTESKLSILLEGVTLSFVWHFLFDMLFSSLCANSTALVYVNTHCFIMFGSKSVESLLPKLLR